MDKYPDIVQLLTIAGPNLESVLEPKDAAECARIANDEMAELVAKYPGPLLRRVRVAADERYRRGARRNGPRDQGAAVPRRRDLHRSQRPAGRRAGDLAAATRRWRPTTYRFCSIPRRTNTTADYEGEPTSKYLIYTNFGWPYETSLAMARLAFGGPLEKFPTLKIVTHHAGGMIPYFHKRVQLSWDFNEMRMGYRHDGQTLTKSPVDYYRMFYCDTAIQGNTPALMCAYEFFGADHMVFATDTPYDNQLGERVTRETIEGVRGDADRCGSEEEDLRRQRQAALQAPGIRTGARG